MALQQRYLLKVLECLVFDLLMLQKSCDGSSGIAGEMAIRLTEGEWMDNYFVFQDIVSLRLNIRNDNDFDLYVRMGLTGGTDNTQLVYTEPIIIPAFTSWDEQEFQLDNLYYTRLFGDTPIPLVFDDISEITFFHNTSLSYFGETVNGDLKISVIGIGAILSSNENSINNL